MEPSLYALGPSSDRERGAAETVAVSTLGVDMQFGRNLGVLERQKVNGGVFDMHRIVLGLHNEGWRGLFGNVDLRIGRKVLVCQSEVTGIDDHGKVRAAAELVGGIDRVVKTLIEVSAKGSSQVGPAEKPRTPIRFWSMCHSVAWERTIPRARWAS